MGTTLEIAIRLGVLFILVAWCFQIVSPFIIPVAWGIILAVAISPLYFRLSAALGGDRPGLAASITTLLMLVVLLIPTWLLADTVVVGATAVAEKLQGGVIQLPPPPDAVKDWPLVGVRIDAFWLQASDNIGTAVETIRPQLRTLGRWLMSVAADAGFAILKFLAAIIIAGVLLAHSTAGGRTAQSIGRRLAGARGQEFVGVAEATLRSVARGILGVALIQALLAGLGFLVVGIPGAGLWALVALFLSIIQIGTLPLMLPLVIYVFYQAEPVTAVAFMIWCVFVGLLDNVLKPLLLGRGVEVPMLVIFVGAIGGFLSSGIIGLFVGSIVLTLGYKVCLDWLDHDAPIPEAGSTLEDSGR